MPARSNPAPWARRSCTLPGITASVPSACVTEARLNRRRFLSRSRIDDYRIAYGLAAQLTPYGASFYRLGATRVSPDRSSAYFLCGLTSKPLKPLIFLQDHGARAVPPPRRTAWHSPASKWPPNSSRGASLAVAPFEGRLLSAKRQAEPSPLPRIDVRLELPSTEQFPCQTAMSTLCLHSSQIVHKGLLATPQSHRSAASAF